MKILSIFCLFFCSSLGLEVNLLCNCVENESLEVAIEQSDLVVIGEITEKRIISKLKREENGRKQNLLFIRYEISVHKSYKGIKKDKK